MIAKRADQPIAWSSKGGQKARRRRTTLTLVVSTVGHLVLLGLLFASASGDIVSSGAVGGGPTGPVFAVTLVRPAAPTSSASDIQASPLIARLQAVQSDNAVYAVKEPRDDSPLRALADRLSSPSQTAAEETAEQAERARDAGALQPSQKRSNPASQGLSPNAKDGSGEGASASTGELWGAIAPCWRNMGSSSRVPVVLEVDLNGGGRLRAPPRILRADDARLDDPRLRAEERALAALAACLPRNDARFGGRTYRLEFPARPNG